MGATDEALTFRSRSDVASRPGRGGSMSAIGSSTASSNGSGAPQLMQAAVVRDELTQLLRNELPAQLRTVLAEVLGNWEIPTAPDTGGTNPVLTRIPKPAPPTIQILPPDTDNHSAIRIPSGFQSHQSQHHPPSREPINVRSPRDRLRDAVVGLQVPDSGHSAAAVGATGAAATDRLPQEIQELTRRLQSAVHDEVRHFTTAVSGADVSSGVLSSTWPIPKSRISQRSQAPARSPREVQTPTHHHRGSHLRVERALPGRHAVTRRTNPIGSGAWDEEMPPSQDSRTLTPSTHKKMNRALAKLRPAALLGSSVAPPSREPPGLIPKPPTCSRNALRNAAEEDHDHSSVADRELQSPFGFEGGDAACDSGDLAAGNPSPPPWPSPNLVIDVTEDEELSDQQLPGCPAPSTEPVCAALPVQPASSPAIPFRAAPGAGVLRARRAAPLDKFRAAAWETHKSISEKKDDSPSEIDGDRQSPATKFAAIARKMKTKDLDDDEPQGADGDAPMTPITGRASLMKHEVELTHTRWGKSILRETLPDNSQIHACLKRIVVSNWFDFGMCAILLLNAVTIGIQVELAAQQDGRLVWDEPDPPEFKHFEQAFCAIFTLELVLRMYVFRWEFFAKDEWRWNTFDCLIVSLQLVEEVIRVTAGGDGVGETSRNMKQLKMLRTLRLLRALRVLRIVKFIQELSNIMYLIIGSFWSFLWTFALLSLLTYISGTFMTQLVSDHIDEDTNMDEAESLREHYGSIGKSVMSFFQAISGGIDWKDLTEPLLPISDMMQWMFLCYIAFGALVMLNLVTGVFVDGARDLRERDKHLDLVRKLRMVLDLAQIRAGGDITWEQFEDQINGEQLKAFFAALSIDQAEAKTVFDLLDVDGLGSISAEEFVQGGLRLQGPAKAIEVAKFTLENQILHGEVHVLTQRVLEELQEIRAGVGMPKTEPTIISTVIRKSYCPAGALPLSDACD